MTRFAPISYVPQNIRHAGHNCSGQRRPHALVSLAMRIIPLLIAMMSTMAVAAATLETATENHPAADVLNRLFAKDQAPPGDFVPTGLTKKDYLPLIGGNVDFFKNFQNDAG